MKECRFVTDASNERCEIANGKLAQYTRSAKTFVPSSI